MFQRRNKASAWHGFLRFLWPEKGLVRNLRYVGHRLGRLPGTPHTVAAGFAFGAAVSFTPLIGLHLLLAAGLAWVTRASMVAAMIGTAIGNPWTFPFIWAGIYRLGAAILGQPLVPLPADPGIGDLLDVAGEIFVPMTLGGLIVSVFVWLAFYYSGRYLVAVYQHRRRRPRPPRGAVGAEEPGHES